MFKKIYVNNFGVVRSCYFNNLVFLKTRFPLYSVTIIYSLNSYPYLSSNMFPYRKKNNNNFFIEFYKYLAEAVISLIYLDFSE